MHRVRILILDRHRDHATTLRLLFEARGCVVLSAEDSHTALDLIATHAPDALVVELDVLGSGAVCGAVRTTNPLGAFIAGIVGLGVDECRCDYRLVKPYEFDALASRMNEFIEERAREKRQSTGG